MLLRKTEAFNGDKFADTLRVDTGIGQRNATSERVADQANREIVDHVEESGEIEDVLGDRVRRSWCPAAVAVAAEIEGINVVVLAEGLRDPIPVACVVQSTVNENECGLVVLTVVPELEFEAVGIEEVGDGFHVVVSPLFRAGEALKIYTSSRSFRAKI
jgi:hypothetical protein